MPRSKKQDKRVGRKPPPTPGAGKPKKRKVVRRARMLQTVPWPAFGSAHGTACIDVRHTFTIDTSTSAGTVVFLGPVNDYFGFSGVAANTTTPGFFLGPIPQFSSLNDQMTSYRWGGFKVEVVNTTQNLNVGGTVRFAVIDGFTPDFAERAGTLRLPPEEGGLLSLFNGMVNHPRIQVQSGIDFVAGKTLHSRPVDLRASMMQTADLADLTIGSPNWAGTAVYSNMVFGGVSGGTGVTNFGVGTYSPIANPCWRHIVMLFDSTAVSNRYIFTVHACLQARFTPGSALATFAQDRVSGPTAESVVRAAATSNTYTTVLPKARSAAAYLVGPAVGSLGGMAYAVGTRGRRYRNEL